MARLRVRVDVNELNTCREFSIVDEDGQGVLVVGELAYAMAAAPQMLAKLKEIHARMACSCRLQPFVGGPVPCGTCQIAAVIASAEEPK